MAYILLALLAAVTSAQPGYLLFQTQFAYESPTNQRDGLFMNVDLFDENREFLSQLFICNTCTFSYYFSDGPY